jgi:hypothetical protein
MASMWRSPVLGILALCTETTRASCPSGSGESVVKYSLMVLHVSDGKRVHQALVDPKSIVPYYVVWDRNASPGNHNLCDPSQSHQTEISSYPQQPDGLGGPEPE